MNDSPDATAKIILAEDDNDMRRFLVKALQTAGYDVASFDNGLSAYNRLREEPFELLLTDIVMPEMDGIEATRRIRDWEAQGAPAVDGRRLPIVALTADAFAEDRERCLACGMDDFLPKPLVASELARVLERWTAPANPAWRA